MKNSLNLIVFYSAVLGICVYEPAYCMTFDDIRKANPGLSQALCLRLFKQQQQNASPQLGASSNNSAFGAQPATPAPSRVRNTFNGQSFRHSVSFSTQPKKKTDTGSFFTPSSDKFHTSQSYTQQTSETTRKHKLSDILSKAQERSISKPNSSSSETPKAEKRQTKKESSQFSTPIQHQSESKLIDSPKSQQSSTPIKAEPASGILKKASTNNGEETTFATPKKSPRTLLKFSRQSTTEVNVYQEKIAQLTKQLQEAQQNQTDVTNLQSENEALKQQITQLQKELQGKQAEIAEMDKDRQERSNNLQVLIETLTAQVYKMHNDHEEDIEYYEEALQQLKQANEELQQLKQANKVLRLTQSKVALPRLKRFKQLEQAKKMAQKFQSKHEAYDQQIAQLQQSLQEAQQNQTDVTKLQSENEALRQQIAQLQNKESKLQKANEEANQKLNEKDSELQKQLQAQKDDYDRRIDELSRKLLESQKQNVLDQDEIQWLRQNNDELDKRLTEGLIYTINEAQRLWTNELHKINYNNYNDVLMMQQRINTQIHNNVIEFVKDQAKNVLPKAQEWRSPVVDQSENLGDWPQQRLNSPKQLQQNSKSEKALKKQMDGK